MKILMIEDNKGDFFLIKNMIEEYGNDIANIHNSHKLSSAFSILEKEKYDLIILDLGLPDSTGIDTFNKVHAKFPDIPIIVLSGREDEMLATLAVRKGAQDYLDKNSLNPQVINRSIRYAIERKQAEDALRQSEDKFKVIFSESLDVIIIIDSYTGLIYNTNPACYQYLGYRIKDLIGKHYSALFPKNNIFNRTDLLSKVIINGSVFESQDFLRRDKTIIPMDVSATLIPWGKTKAILLSLRDATERKHIESTLSSLNRDLEQRVLERTAQLEATMYELKSEISFRKIAEEQLLNAKNEITKAWEREKELNELKSRFVSMVSHEYRTPLSVISSSAEFLESFQKDSDATKFSKHIRKIIQAVQTMTNLLENVLTIEKINSKNLPLKLEAVEIVGFVHELIEVCSFTDGFRHNIVLKSNAEKIYFVSDSNLLHLILNNLITNAQKYSSQDSTITIGIELSNSILSISVSDNGIGIKSEELAHIFEPFHRGENTDNIHGFGVGLNIVKNCIDSLNGKITASSIPSEGTTFLISLPDIAMNHFSSN